MTQIVQFPTKAKEVIIRPIPDQLIKQREGGGKKILSYISGSTVIDLLNEAFGYMWSWNVEQEWIQDSQPKFNPKYDKEPIPQSPVAHVRGTLTVHLFNDAGERIEIKKSGLGSKSILGGQNDQESIFKAAGTDALKKAASLFGIGAQLYRDEEEQAFFDAINYENPWTDELLEKFKSERDYISQIMKANEATTEDMAEIIADWSKGACIGLEDIVPGNIVEFVTFLIGTQAEDVAS